MSRTILIKKCNKPRVKDYRPMVVTDISYKILMSFIKKVIEEHLKVNGMGKDNKVGFSEGGRTVYNHFIIQY